MKDKVFIDSNIILYINQKVDDLKKQKALSLLGNDVLISPQIVFECINVCFKKYKFSLQDSIVFAEMLLENTLIVSETLESTKLAIKIFEKYKLQTFDSKIIATALFHNCTILYSEDMQHGLVIEDKLTIVNPFLNK